MAQELDPVRWLADELRVEFPGDGEVMNIGIVTESAKESALLVAAVSKAYLDEVVNQERLQRSQHLAELQSTLSTHQDEFDSKSGSLQTLGKQLGSNDSQTLSHQQRMTQESLAAIRKELITVQFEKSQKNVDLKAKKAKLESATADGGAGAKSLVSQLDLESVVSSDLITANLKAQAQDAQEALTQLRNFGAGQQSNHEQKLRAEMRSDRTEHSKTPRGNRIGSAATRAWHTWPRKWRSWKTSLPRWENWNSST